MNKVMYPSPIRIIYPLLSFGGLVKKERNICCFDNRRFNNSKHLLSVLSTVRICPSTLRTTTTRYLNCTETIQKEQQQQYSKNIFTTLETTKQKQKQCKTKTIPSPEKIINQERNRI